MLTPMGAAGCYICKCFRSTESTMELAVAAELITAARIRIAAAIAAAGAPPMGFYCAGRRV